MNQIYKSHVFNVAQNGIWHAAVSAIIRLKDLHPFFDKVPLMRDCYFRMTLNLNQSSITVNKTWTAFRAAGDGNAERAEVNTMTVSNIVSPLGGIQPIMVASALKGSGLYTMPTGNYTISLAVGASCLNSNQLAGGQCQVSPMARAVMMFVPTYVFNPVFENSYLSQSVKNIEYSDFYFYQVVNQQAGQNIQALISNGISNLKSITVIPFYDKSNVICGGVDPLQSPFDPAGGGTTSPMCYIQNFNVLISGQNALYTAQKYVQEGWLHQLCGINSVNGAQNDGVTSGLINSLDYENSYCYYHVDVSRMLPVERTVPKSISLVGTNASSQILNLYVFSEYSCSLALDILSGARVS